MAVDETANRFKQIAHLRDRRVCAARDAPDSVMVSVMPPGIDSFEVWLSSHFMADPLQTRCSC